MLFYKPLPGLLVVKANFINYLYYKSVMAEKSRTGLAIVVIIFILFLVSMFFAGMITLALSGDTEYVTGNVALIPLSGVITADRSSSFLGDQNIASPDVISLIEKAEKNPSIKAIVFEINSPGGSAVGSEEIANAVSKVKKPKVALIREVGASGGYWVASSTDHIVANRMSVVGSVGVISSYLEFPGLLDKYNVTYRRLIAGKYKDVGSPFKTMTSEEEAMLMRGLEDTHEYFIESIAKNRKLDRRAIDEVSTAAVYTGREALQLGLIDEIGGRDEVTAYLKKTYDIDAEYTEYKTKRGFFESLEGVFSSFSFRVGEGIGSSLVEQQNDMKIYS